jgi:carnitine 3-dehydrogenase
MVEKVFARKAYDPAVIRAGERVPLTDPTDSRRAKRMSEIRKAAIIGGGVIGGGWAARFLLNGWDVIVSDPDPEAERKVGEVLANARRSLPALSDVSVPKEGRLRFAASIADAVAGADWIQESVPERLDIKHTILADIQKHCREDALIGSSTSGFKPSELQAGRGTPRADLRRPSLQPGLSACR